MKNQFNIHEKTSIQLQNSKVVKSDVFKTHVYIVKKSFKPLNINACTTALR
jgi:hypothetical protein